MLVLGKSVSAPASTPIAEPVCPTPFSDTVFPLLTLLFPTLSDAVPNITLSPCPSVTTAFHNRGREVKAEMLHVVAQQGPAVADGWVGMHGELELPLEGAKPIRVEYRPDQRTLPMTVKLLDFRKIDYPGIQLAAGFESDVELSDPARGVVLMRTIKMNHPLKYRGYTFFQSSYVANGGPETTILSVRNDPGTPLVYAGFLIVLAGVVSLFVMRRSATAGVGGRPAITGRSLQ